jgi:polar amino acid transport system substrate-binding protein
MKPITRLRSALVVVGAASLLASTAITAVTAGASTTSGVYNAKDAALVPAALKHVTWQVATDASYPPDEFFRGTTMVGFDLDLMKALATTLGVKYKENNVTFATIIAGIQGGRYQIGNSSFTPTLARQKQVNFVDYYQAGEGVYVKSTSKFVFKNLQSFCGHKVAVEATTTEQTDAANVKCAGGKKVNVEIFQTQNQANTAVESGQADAGFLDSQVAGYVVATAKGIFKLTGSPVNVAPYGIATAKTPSGLQLAKSIDAAMKTLVANGTYNAILKQWGAQSGEIPASQMILNGAKS